MVHGLMGSGDSILCMWVVGSRGGLMECWAAEVYSACSMAG